MGDIVSPLIEQPNHLGQLLSYSFNRLNNSSFNNFLPTERLFRDETVSQ